MLKRMAYPPSFLGGTDLRGEYRERFYVPWFILSKVSAVYMIAVFDHSERNPLDFTVLID